MNTKCTIPRQIDQSRIMWFLALTILSCSCASISNKENKPSPFVTDTVKYDNGNMTAIAYSSPSARDREVWNQLVPYGELWRTGANEATVFTTTIDLLIGSDTLKAGKYSVFTIPNDEEWTIIFNKDWEQWGAYGYNQEEDALRILLLPTLTDKHQEEMTISIRNDQFLFHWKNISYTMSMDRLD